MCVCVCVFCVCVYVFMLLSFLIYHNGTGYKEKVKYTKNPLFTFRFFPVIGLYSFYMCQTKYWYNKNLMVHYFNDAVVLVALSNVALFEVVHFDVSLFNVALFTIYWCTIYCCVILM